MFEWPIAHPIDLSAYPRRRTYELFLDFDNPTTTRTVQIELTALMAYIKSRGLRFMPAIGFILMRAINLVPELRQRIQDDIPVEFIKIIPSFTIFCADGQIGFAKGVYTDEFSYDYAANVSIIDSVCNGCVQDVGLPSLGFAWITNNPWNTFSSLAFPFSRKFASVPIIAIGKMFHEGSRVMAPLAIQTHHSFVDGYQLAHFFDILNRHLESPHLIESHFVSEFA